jgi:hypothetical protein
LRVDAAPSVASFSNALNHPSVDPFQQKFRLAPRDPVRVVCCDA